MTDSKPLNQITNFENDIQQGKLGEKIFKRDFLDFLNIKYSYVANCQQFQLVDTDYVTKIGTCEVKTNYKDRNEIFIEEYTNINENLAPINYGWLYKSKADLIIFVSKKTGTMVFLPFNNPFKEYYEKIKNKFQLKRNKISYFQSYQWQSAFRIIPLLKINGFYSMYKRFK